MKPTQTVMFRTADLPLFSNTAQPARLETYAPKPAKQPELPTAAHHVIIYNNKRVVMDYIENPKEEFKYACMRISDNNATGIVITPDGKQYQVTPYSKTARLIDPRTITPPTAPTHPRSRTCDPETTRTVKVNHRSETSPACVTVPAHYPPDSEAETETQTPPARQERENT